MSKNHLVCFRHLKADCECVSPKKLLVHQSTRIPEKENISAWKKFLKWIIGNNYRGERIDLKEATKNTKLETYYINQVNNKI